MVHSKSKCCWKIHLLNPWQISENWSICRLTSSPIRPPPTPTRPPPTPTPISITLKQRANVETLCNVFVDFLVVLIMQRGRIMQKRKSCRTLRLLSVSLRWKIYNIHEPNSQTGTQLVEYHFICLSPCFPKFSSASKRNMAMVYRRQRFIRYTSSYVWYIEILRMFRANDNSNDLTAVGSRWYENISLTSPRFQFFFSFFLVSSENERWFLLTRTLLEGFTFDTILYFFWSGLDFYNLWFLSIT